MPTATYLSFVKERARSSLTNRGRNVVGADLYSVDRIMFADGFRLDIVPGVFQGLMGAVRG